jgi:hypothetical protein
LVVTQEEFEMTSREIADRALEQAVAKSTS